MVVLADQDTVQLSDMPVLEEGLYAEDPQRVLYSLVRIRRLLCEEVMESQLVSAPTVRQCIAFLQPRYNQFVRLQAESSLVLLNTCIYSHEINTFIEFGGLELLENVFAQNNHYVISNVLWMLCNFSLDEQEEIR